MKRRALLSSLGGGPVLLAGCASSPFSTETGDVYNPTGTATIRPIDEPLMQGGLTSGSEQYLYARMFHPGDTLAVTDIPDADRFSAAIEDLSEGEFAILTKLRTAAAAPAYFWASGTDREDGRLEITVERQTGPYDGTGDEVVGVALIRFDYDGETPTGADVIFPGGATIPVGQPDR